MEGCRGVGAELGKFGDTFVHLFLADQGTGISQLGLLSALLRYFSFPCLHLGQE